MPSDEQINNAQNFKGLTYQRKARDGPSAQNAPKVTTPNIPKVNDIKESVDLSFDLGNWLANTKVHVPVLELCKIPGQREKLLKISDPPNDANPQNEASPLSPVKPPAPKKVTFHNTVERTSNNVFADPPIVLHTRDPRKEDHPPFYVSLMIGDLLLHNCMLDSGSSSSIMTKKVMQQFNLKTTRPYQNVCAMDSRPVKVEGMIENQLVRLAKYPDI